MSIRNSGFVQHILGLMESLDKQSMVIRIFALVLSTLLLFFIWFFLLWAPQKESLATLRLNIQSQTLQLGALDKQVQSLNTKLLTVLSQKRSDSAAEPKNSQTLQETAFFNAYHQVAARVIPASSLQDTLASVLVTPNIQLNGMQMGSSDLLGTLSASNLKASIFQHNIKLTFTGNYFSTLAYLQMLNDLKWEVYLNNISYKVKQYPNAEVTLDLYAISLQEGG